MDRNAAAREAASGAGAAKEINMDAAAVAAVVIVTAGVESRVLLYLYIDLSIYLSMDLWIDRSIYPSYTPMTLKEKIQLYSLHIYRLNIFCSL